MKLNNNIFQKKIFYIIPIVFLIMASIRITYAYFDIKHQEEVFAKSEARVLNKFFMVNRIYHQNLFTNKSLQLNKKTFLALPAFSAEKISELFSQNNDLNISIKTVSDRARNPKNKATDDEIYAINIFKKDKDKKDLFLSQDKYYQYAFPLKIEPKCLTCHGKKSEAPSFISEKYDTAYDYKLGEVRGIVSIKIPKENLKSYFTKDFIYSVFYDIFIFLLLFIFIIYLINKFNVINSFLRITIKDKTEKLSKQNSFLESYTSALNQSSAISKTDPAGIITYVNKNFCELTGYTKEELVGNKHSIIKSPKNKPSLYKTIWNTIQNKKIWSGRIKGVSKNGETFIAQTSIVPVLNENNHITGFISTKHDITELIHSKEDIKQTLITDQLTKLKNRCKLLEDIHNKKSSPFLCLMNIDGFKEINDFYGNKTADKLLISLALRISKLCNDSNINVYKLHADEFALLKSDYIKDAFINNINEIIQAVSSKAFEIKDHTIYITISGGISFEENDLFMTADMALQKAKQKNEHLFIYNKSINNIKDITRNINGIKMLKEAIETNTICPFYQPIFNLKTSKIEKYESLARIVLHDKVYAPYSFLNIAKRSKLYPYITKAIVKKSFEYFKDSPYEFSINISIMDVLNKKTTQFIKEELKNFTQCKRIVFEILESEEIKNIGLMRDFIKEIKSFGCKIAIDDFGSGYSNFSHILELDVDYLKIDASLIKNITKNNNSKIIVQGIVDFSKRLKIKTIAEYVETKESLDLLTSLGVDFAQGYYIDKPKKDIK